MYRLAFFIIFSCIVSACCVQELVGQPSEGRARGRGPRADTPPPAQPVDEQPADAQSTDEQLAAEEEQASEESAASESVSPPPPPNSLVQIIHPDKADRLGLTEAQRSEANRIVKVQTIELANAQEAKAPPERFLEIYKQTEEKLLNLLTVTQQAIVKQGFERKEFGFVFSEQPWKDVLQFIANQCGYQLIMDAPPQGTFSYADREKHTITEILNHINGILITKGYTLVRDNRVLMLLDLRNPIPNKYFPSVKPEELAGRASNEYVSVQFNLERRNRENVLQGIKPLETNSLYTKVYPLGGNNLLVIADVETLLAIQKVIDSVENPSPPHREEPKPPQPSVWKTYTIEKNDPNKIESIFNEHVTDAKMLRLPDSRELHILARPDQHVQFEAILKMLEEDAGAGLKDASLVSYQFSQYFDAQGLPMSLRRQGFGRGTDMSMFPQGTFPPGTDPSQFFPMNPIQRFGMEIIAQLKNAFPKATISDMPVADRIIVWASEADQKNIGEFFESLCPTEENRQEAKLYRYTEQGKKMNETTQQQIQSLLPNARLTLDAERGQILVIATVKEHAELTKMVKELEAAATYSEDKILRNYQLSASSIDTFWSLVSQLAAQNHLRGYIPIRDSQRNQYLIWASEKQHKRIEDVYHELTGQSQQADGEEPDAVVLFTPKHIALDTLQTVIQDVYPTAKLVLDARRKQIIIRIRPHQKEPLQSLLAELDADDPDEEKRSFRAYPIESGFYSLTAGFNPNRPNEVVSELGKLVPGAKITFDVQSHQIIIWGTDEEHAKIGEALRHLIGEKGGEKTFRVFPLRRVEWASIAGVIQRMYPSVELAYDLSTKRIFAEGHPKLLQKVAELIDILDPVEPSEHDPVVKFYAIRPEPSVLEGITRIVPTATIIPDQKQILVIAKPADHKIIELNTKLIAETFTALEEPVLCIYTVTQEERNRLTSFITEIAGTDLRDAKIFPARDGETTAASADRMLIWARPTEHELIATVLKQFKESQATTPERQFKSFPMSVGDLETAQSILRATHPDAILFPDLTGNRLMVLATAEDMEKVTRTLRVQGSIDDRAMVAYPVAGVSPETIQTVITNVYQGLKINVDTVSRKIFIWASPEEHVKIGEIIEQANKEIDPDSELSEKFAAYSAANLDTAMVVRLFETMVPGASVYANPGDDKIVVRAIARDHQQISELFEKLREKDERFRPKLVVYPFGETDPVMVEAMLQNQLPDAESMSPDDLIRRLGYSFYYARLSRTDPYYARMYGMTLAPVKKEGYFKVDPPTRSVYIFATTEQHETIGKAMEQIVAAGNREGVKLTVQRYSLDEIDDMYYVRPLIQQVAPSAMIQMIPSREHLIETSWGSYYDYDYREFFAYTNEGEHEKIAALIKEMNDRQGVGKKELLPVTMPENTPFSREKLLATLQNLFSDITPLPGGTTNQILFWSTKHRLEQVQKIVDDVCRPLPEGERTIPKSYSLRYISVEEAVTWLSALHPNASFDPEKLTATDTTKRPPTVRPAPRPDEAKIIVAVATPLEHVEIEKTIRELDKELPDHLKMTPREYALDNMPAGAFQPFFASLGRVFPHAVVTPSPQGMSVMVVAIEDDHKKIAEFVKAYRDDNERKRPGLEIYTLKRLNYYQVYQLIQRIVPTAAISAGSKPDQIAVWGPPKEQADIAEALARMETAAETGDVSSQKLKAYKAGTGKAHLSSQLLTYQFPSALVFPINQNEILAWASPVIHEAIESMLESVAEVFPDPVVQPYFFKHVSLTEGAAILQQVFAGQEVTITPRYSTQDLMVLAVPNMHEKIAASIALFDVPRPADRETSLKFYDMSELPADSFAQVASQLRLAVQNRSQVLPGIVPGQMAVWAKPEDHETINKLVEQILAGGFMPRSQTFDLSDLSPGALGSAIGQIQAALAYRVQVFQGVVPGQLIVWGKPADLEKVETLVKQMLNDRSDATAEMKVYAVQRGNARAVVEQLILQIAPHSRFYAGTSINQIVVWAKAADHIKIKEAVDKLNESDPDVSLKIYRTGTQKAATAQSLLQQRFPGLIVFPTTPNEIVAWATSAEHETIAQLLETVAEAFPDPELRPYFFKHVPLGEAAGILQQAFAGQVVAMIPRPTTQDLMVFASADVHERIAASIAKFDVVRPAETEMMPKIYDLSVLPPTAFWQAASQVREALQYRIQVSPGAEPGLLIVWAIPADQEKVGTLIGEMLSKRTERESRTFDLSDLPPGAFYPAMAQIQAALDYRVQAFQGVVPGQMIVWGKPADLEKVETLVKQMLNDRSEATAEMKVYTVQRGNARTVVDQLILQIAPNARFYAGTSINQIVVWAKAADHIKIKEAVDKLNESDPDVSLKIYRTGTQKAATAQSLLQQRFPGLIVFPTTPNELVAWATSAEHETIAQLLETVAEAFPNPVLKPYYFKHVPLGEAWTILYHAFSGAVTAMTPRPATQDLLVFATPEVHEQIAASIANFDVQRPEGTEALPKTYDLSDLPSVEFWQAVSNIPVALESRVRVMPGVTPGQLIVWGKPADHEKVDMMVKQILAERPETTAAMEVYALRRGTVANVGALLTSVFPNIKPPRQGTSPNQMLVWAKASDHRKINDLINRLNKSDPDMSLETYSLKNVDWYSATNILGIMITREGLDIQLYPDNTYSKRLVVLAKPEEQQRVAAVLESFRLEDRTVESYHLEYTDPFSVQSAIRVLFFDEPYATRPMSDVEPNTNMIFVDGTKEQLAKVRKLLRDMGENIKEPVQPAEEPHNVPVPAQPQGNIRMLQLRSGETAEILRELEKHWKQSNQSNQLRIIKTEEITPPQFSMEDEIQRENPQANPQTEEDGKAASSLADLLPSIPPVYVVASEDGALTITSADTAALDQLEALLKRLNSRIVFEGRDYTIYSVRNISANVIYQRLQIVLRDKIQRGQTQQSGAANTAGIPFQITPDIAANTIMVRGSRVDRQEVAKLIALFDVSELPGERIVQKPITVPIENTEANRVFNEVQKVYGVKMAMTQLPGGVQPRIVVNSTTNSLEIFAPEPLATELAEYIKEVDNRAQEEPGRKLHVIQMGVKASVVQQAIFQMQQQMRMQMLPYGIQPYPYPVSPYPYPGGIR